MNISDSHIINHTQCPVCKKKGKDTSKDNLGSFSDGHQYCFACGYYVPADKIRSFKTKETQQEPDNKIVRLPPDSMPFSAAPARAVKWLQQYELTSNQIIANNIMWSESRQRLIFPYFINGELAAWQGRWFGPTPSAKWYTDGKIDKILYIRGAQKDTLVLTEDIISAIKVSSFCAASPIFGSVISAHRFKAIATTFSNVIIWLDPDKQKEAVKFASIGQLFGLNCRVILSEKDPKEHTQDEIKTYLQLE